MNENRTYWRLQRKGKDITLKEIADYVGYSVSMISKYELGQREMSEDKERLYKSYIVQN